MLRGGPALATVVLCFVLVLSQDPPLSLQDLIRRVEVLIRKAPRLSWLDSRLYTPSAAKSQNCLVSTINCFAAEVQVLLKEWEKVGEGVQLKVDLMLQSLAKSLNKTAASRLESGCRRCELFQEDDAEKFLLALLSTLQYIVSAD